MNEGFIFKYGGIKRMSVTESEGAGTSASKEPTKTCPGCGRVLPLSEFLSHPRSKDGRMKECAECHRRRIHGSKTNTKGNPLAQFTARQLMHELYLRGYEGEVSFVEVHKIRLSDM